MSGHDTREFLALDISLTLLNTGFTDETSQQSGKQNSFRHILKSSDVHESSGFQFRFTTGL